jgi:hypothetical protein
MNYTHWLLDRTHEGVRSASSAGVTGSNRLGQYMLLHVLCIILRQRKIFDRLMPHLRSFITCLTI